MREESCSSSRPRPRLVRPQQLVVETKAARAGLCLAILLVVAPGACPSVSRAGHPGFAGPPATDDASILRLRIEGRYAAALALARSREAVLRVMPGAPRWRIEDVSRLVGTLRLAADLPDSARLALSGADKAEGDIERLIIRGKYREAVRLAEKQLATRRLHLGPENQETVRSLQWLAELMALRFGGERATSAQEEVVTLRRRVLGGHHPELAESLTKLGYDLKNQGYPDALQNAEKAFRAALEIRLRAPSSTDSVPARRPEDALSGAGAAVPVVEDRGVLSALFALADLNRARRDFPAAEAGLREVLRRQEASLGPKHPDVIVTLSVLAYVLEVRGRYREAEPLARRAVDLALLAEDLRQVDRAFALSILGYASLHEGRPAEAERLFTRTVRIHEMLRLENEDDPLNGNVQLTNYLARARAQLEQGRNEEAWRSLERGTNRRVLDALVPSPRVDDGSVPPDADRPDPRFVTLARAQQALPEDAALIGWLDLAWSSTPSDDCFYAYVIKKTGPVRWFRGQVAAEGSGTRPYSRTIAFCAEMYEASRSAIRVTEVDHPLRLARDLYDERFSPLESSLEGINRLIVVQSSAPFSPVPVEALVDPRGTAVGDRYEVGYTPSATVFTLLRNRPAARRPAKEWRALLVGDPEYPSVSSGSGDRNRAAAPSWFDQLLLRGLYSGDRAAFSRLPPLARSQEEVLRAAAIFRSATLLLRSQASAPNLRALAASGEIGGYDLIHFATHALPAVGAYMGALALSPAARPLPAGAGATRRGQDPRVEDCLLDAPEITSWHLRADLVTLSACHSSGLGYTTDAPLGLSKFFLMAGARTVMASLWRVDDTATSLLMARFYENICGAYADHRGGEPGAAMSTPAALREAKLWLRDLREPDGSRLFRHPVYWAGFILIGDALD